MTTPVNKVTGIGPKTVEFLAARGINSAEALLDAGIGVLCEAPGFGEGRANTVLSAAKALLASGAPQPAQAGKDAKGKKEKKPKKDKKGKKKTSGKDKKKKDKKDKKEKKKKSDKKKK